MGVRVVIETVAIAGAIIAVSAISPRLVVGAYTTFQHTAYITATTIIASILTASISSAMEGLWVQRVDCKFARHLSDDRLPELNGKWRTALGIANLTERARNIPVPFSYLVTSLVTTAIVASFAPSLGTQTIPSTVQIPDGQPSWCASVGSNPFYSWKLPNGSSFGIAATWQGCPHRYALSLMGLINTADANVTAYADEGVAVHPSAMGASVALYSSAFRGLGEELHQLLLQYGNGLVSTSFCVPVMIRNPISCRIGGIAQTDLRSISVTSDNGLCNSTLGVAVRNGASQIGVFCPRDEVGQGTIAIGATGTYTTTLLWAVDPASIGTQGSSTLAVTCDVDTRNVYEHRAVSLVLQSRDTVSAQQGAYARRLSAVGFCDASVNGTKNAIGEALLAISATANWQDLSQNQFWDGLMNSLWYATSTATDITRSGPWAFNDSRNALEDVLGVTAALVASRINSTTITLDGNAVVVTTQMGSGKASNFAFAAIPLLSACLLIFLIGMTRHVGEVRYRTSSLLELIQVGNQRQNLLRHNSVMYQGSPGTVVMNSQIG
ncbi:hypothetical protein FoTM2_016646 [Fusarium oxysporum f. sp. vasinfectum]|uniref:Uncharacterized protein n=1 Tax=Fusarium oxysporum f. sp. vasinfectum 25433 TaxID=1089449 RepID=X0KVR4_FUSOX|nr:hypothetical protein FOTG_18668 [Fusarium oxysporum f. sp. vasinfectum 25433]KAK2923124.1 hypothetical protein FoTM2_016646 [Fusarium oxysporum f. sp. vasinfectum]